ncbi:MAG: metallophosphoesterase [Deinococcota bacterium]|uniref:Metallophosphoesterase n=1 Tax=Allomeiothermus silvanus (strain ATCC 700542 / DSM 9946 / NBRC 106475 / NCIMB 13440 / VI-R2) TaxID=526227 RepID=D7BG76_ALLS1|nr:metallophosphoesterase [Allomeiothermus silvanus]ADH61997.1 metallophosphoesterase [Allomeiothermus silvanus DSM 9946]MBI5813878.1 metallophosphoesterase [Allomeiothermus silvanus]
MHYVIGDIHGCLEGLVRLLQGTGLIGEEREWTGGKTQLWCLGDYTDRGPDGVGVIELLMRLEREAEAAGGAVNALLGNHDVILQQAYYFPERKSGFAQGGRHLTFHEMWLRAGGQEHDRARLAPRHIAWLARRPALAQVDGVLLMHSDSDSYLHYGSSVEEINARIKKVLHSDDYRAWDRLEERLAARLAFWGGLEKALDFLGRMGAERLLHGHTPIYSLLGCSPEEVTEPLEYAEGLCVNLEHAIWKGGPGFIYRLEGA